MQISLGGKESLVPEDLMLEGIKLFSYVRELSRKEAQLFTVFTSNIIFKTISIFSAKTDPTICVDSFFWKELRKALFELFWARVFLLQWWKFWPVLWFFGWSKVLYSHCQTLDRSWQKHFRWIDFWILYRDGPRNVIAAKNKVLLIFRTNLPKKEFSSDNDQ